MESHLIHVKLYFSAKSGTIKSLHIRNATLHELNVSGTDHIEDFTISDGYIHRITGRFASSITCLNLSGTALEDISDNALSSLTHLAVLDVSHNNLTRLPQMPLFAARKENETVDFWLDISGMDFR